MCGFVSCHPTHFLERVCLDEIYGNPTEHFNTPVKQANSKALPTPTTAEAKLNFRTAHDLSLCAKKAYERFLSYHKQLQLFSHGYLCMQYSRWDLTSTF